MAELVLMPTIATPEELRRRIEEFRSHSDHVMRDGFAEFLRDLDRACGAVDAHEASLAGDLSLLDVTRDGLLGRLARDLAVISLDVEADVTSDDLFLADERAIADTQLRCAAFRMALARTLANDLLRARDLARELVASSGSRGALVSDLASSLDGIMGVLRVMGGRRESDLLGAMEVAGQLAVASVIALTLTDVDGRAEHLASLCQIFNWSGSIIYGLEVAAAERSNADANDGPQGRDAEHPMPTAAAEDFDVTLLDRLDSAERIDNGRAAVESILRRIENLISDLPDGEDSVYLERFRTTFTSLMAIDPLPVAAINGSLVDAWRHVHRLDPPQVAEIAAQRQRQGTVPEIAQLEAELVRQLEDAIADQSASNDGSGWNQPLAIARQLGELIIRDDRGAESAAEHDPVIKPGKPEPAWDDLRGLALKARNEGIANLVKTSFEHPLRTMRRAVSTLTVAFVFLKFVRPFVADLLLWAFAALKNRVGVG